MPPFVILGVAAVGLGLGVLWERATKQGGSGVELTDAAGGAPSADQSQPGGTPLDQLLQALGLTGHGAGTGAAGGASGGGGTGLSDSGSGSGSDSSSSPILTYNPGATTNPYSNPSPSAIGPGGVPTGYGPGGINPYNPGGSPELPPPSLSPPTPPYPTPPPPGSNPRPPGGPMPV